MTDVYDRSGSTLARITPVRKGAPKWLPITIIVLVLTAALLCFAYKAILASPIGDVICFCYNLSGNNASENGNWDEANADYSQVIAIRPRKVDGYLLRGINEDKARQFSSAIADDTAGLAVSTIPEVVGDLYFNRAMADVSLHRLNDAISDYTMASSQYSNRLGCGCSESPLQQKRELDKRQMSADEQLSYLYYIRSNYPAGIKASSAALAFDQTDDYGYLMRGKSELCLLQDAAATNDFINAFHFSQNPSNTLAQAGTVVDKTRQYRVGLAIYNDASRALPNTPDVLGSLGWYQYEAGEYTSAIGTDERSLNLAHDSNTDLGWIRFNLALTYAALGQNSLAQTAYTNALANCRPADIPGAISDLKNLVAKHPDTPLFQTELLHVEQASKSPQ